MTPITSDNDSTLAGSSKGASSILSPNGAPGLRSKLEALLQTESPLLSPEEQRRKYSTGLSQTSKNFEKERSEQGKVKWTVYLRYLESASRIGVIFFILSILAQQGLTICMLHEVTFVIWAE